MQFNYKQLFTIHYKRLCFYVELQEPLILFPHFKTTDSFFLLCFCPQCALVELVFRKWIERAPMKILTA